MIKIIEFRANFDLKKYAKKILLQIRTIFQMILVKSDRENDGEIFLPRVFIGLKFSRSSNNSKNKNNQNQTTRCPIKSEFIR